MIKLNDLITYAEDGVHQCWSCENQCGIKPINTNIANFRVVLPECKIIEKYMIRVNNPCPKYVPKVRGKWIVIDDEHSTVHGKCSICGWEAYKYEDDVVGMPFCPNCGKRLE